MGYSKQCDGGVPEWTNGTVSKTVTGTNPSVAGPNPAPSAIPKQFTRFSHGSFIWKPISLDKRRLLC
jgi:hypothetical protein